MLVLLCSVVFRRLFALTEDADANMWEAEELCLGDELVCHGGLVGNESLARKILSFGEDEDGELVIN